MSGCRSSAACEVSKVINDSLKINTFPKRICRDSTVKFLLHSVGATRLNPHDLHFVSNLLENKQLKQLEAGSVTRHRGALQHSRQKSALELKCHWETRAGHSHWAVLGVPGCRRVVFQILQTFWLSAGWDERGCAERGFATELTRVLWMLSAERSEFVLEIWSECFQQR